MVKVSTSQNMSLRLLLVLIPVYCCGISKVFPTLLSLRVSQITCVRKVADNKRRALTSFSVICLSCTKDPQSTNIWRSPHLAPTFGLFDEGEKLTAVEGFGHSGCSLPRVVLMGCLFVRRVKMGFVCLYKRSSRGVITTSTLEKQFKDVSTIKNTIARNVQ
eukprot:6244839-Amphidinium_carterae.1